MENTPTSAERAVERHTVEVSGTRLSYRAAGSPRAPAVVLLHGFPSSSYAFRRLLPALAGTRRVVAPDLPGFGESGLLDGGRGPHTFERMAAVVQAFLRSLDLGEFAMVLHDYGAQVGFRVALGEPRRVRALVLLNSEAHETEGRTRAWSHIQEYWRTPSAENRERLRRGLLSEDGLRKEFVEDLPPEEAAKIEPETVRQAREHLSRPAVVDALLDLHLDYRTNVELFPAIQAYLRSRTPPALVIWGRDDQYYAPDAAYAYRRELPDSEVHVIDGGHWALETQAPRVIALTREFLDRAWPPR